MIKIGLFATIGQVSIDALRHYDRLGLLKPSQVDAFTGYRYYTLEQLPRLHRILALKDLGLSLEQIALLLDGDVSADQVRAMLRSRMTQLQDAQMESAAQLARLRVRLVALDTEDEMSTQEILLKQVEPLLVAGRRFILKENKGVVLEDLTGAFMEAKSHVLAHGNKQAGPSIAAWYTPTTQFVDEDVEAAFPLSQPIQATERIQVHTLPGGLMASILHTGDFREFSTSVKALVKWVDDNGYDAGSPYREIYHKFDPANIEDVMVEVQMPVSRK